MSDISANNKRIAKNTLVLYVRMFFILAITLYTSRVVLKVLGVEDFGIYNVVGGVVAMMGLLKGAMSAATTRFITFELGRRNFEQLRKTFCTSVMIYILICIIFVILAETIGLWFLNTKLTIPIERQSAANWVYQFTIMSLFIEMICQPYNAVIISHEKMSFYAYVSILEVALRLLIVLLLLLLPFDHLALYGLLMMATSIVVCMTYHFYCQKRFAECKFKLCKDKDLFITMLSYSGWNLFGSASSLVKGQGLNILLNVFFNPAVNAARGIAYQIYGAISQFSQNFYTAVRPQITKYYAQNDLMNMFKLVFRSSKLSFYLNLLLGVPLIIEMPQIITLWLGQKPDYVVAFSRLIIVISMIDAMAHPLMTSIHSTGHVALYQSLVGFLNILNLPISYVFLKVGYTPIVVFYISLIITIVSLFIRLAIVKRYILLFPVANYIISVFVVCILVSIISSILPIVAYCYFDKSLFSIFVVCLVSVFSVMLTAFLIGLRNDERKFIIRIINQKVLHRCD